MTRHGNLQNGFTIVELMIAVSLIGIMSAIALPGYHGFVTKVRISQAKVALGQIYTAEKIFQIENNSFTTRLDAMGFNMNGSTYFDVGFSSDFPPPANSFQGNPACQKMCPVPACATTPAWTCQSTALFGLDGTIQGTATATTFQAVAHAHLVTLNLFGSLVDARTLYIDDTKTLRESALAQ